MSLFDTTNGLLRTTFALALVALTAPAALADVVYNVSLDTSALTANPGQGAFYVDFELNDGSLVDGVGNNTATITNFTLGTGGSLLGSPDSVSSSLGTSVNPTYDLSNNLTTLSITDSSYQTDFNQAFTPGTSSSSQLSFTLDLTTLVSTTETASPDAFIFQVFSNVTPNLENSTTTSQASYLELDITAAGVTVQEDIGGSLGNGTVTPAAVVTQENQPGPAVPGPSTFTLLAVGLVGLAARGRWRRRAV